MAILPLQLARVSNALRTSLPQQSIARTQQDLLNVQNELSTGKRLNAPSDDPGDAAIAQQLRKTLEARASYATNLTQATNQLGDVDTSLASLTDLLRQAQSIASANVGSDVTADQRSAAAAVVQSLYSQALNIGNTEFQGAFLFGGDRGTAAPFVESNGGVKFVGSDNVLYNDYDENTSLAFTVNGSDVFGALSTRIRGSVDLSPAVSAATRLSDLKGATGDEVQKGSIRISTGTASAVVDLADADTLGDVITRINNSGIGVTAALAAGAQSINISGGATDTLSVTEAGSTTASDLGILNTTATAAGAPVNGANLQPQVTPLTPLSSLRDGAGIDTAHGLVITNGLTTATIDLSGATTVEDALNAINGSSAGVLARINAAGNGIDLLNPIQGVSMSVAENGGTTAADLGIRSSTAATPLSQLNNGAGVRTVAGADFSITRRDGTSFNVDLTNESTVQDVINTINAAAGGAGIAATFAATGNGIVLTDSTGASGPIVVSALNASTAAADLGLAGSANAVTLQGADTNKVQAAGIFANLGALRDALQSNDSSAITAAAQGVGADLDRVVRVRGATGARVQEFQNRQQGLDDQNVATKSLLSSLEDVDFASAVSQFQTLQTTLQADYQTAAKVLNLSLLDFLG